MHPARRIHLARDRRRRDSVARAKKDLKQRAAVAVAARRRSKRRRRGVRPDAPTQTLEQPAGGVHWGGYDGSGKGGADGMTLVANKRRRRRRRRHMEGDSMDWSGNNFPGGFGAQWERGRPQKA